MDTFSFIVAGVMVYIAVAVFIIGMTYQIVGWFRAPKSSVRLGLFPKPRTKTRRFFKVLKDSFIFPQSYAVDKATWIFAIVFHGSLLVILLAHFRLVREFTPLVNLLGKEGMDTLSAIGGKTLGIIIIFPVLFYLFRRFLSPHKELSVPEDYFLVIILIFIIAFGDHLRFFADFHTEDYREYVQSLLVFRPSYPEAIANSDAKWVLSSHVMFVNIFVIYFPFSKLMHIIGTFAANKVRSD
jgi:nitrate reductase gamma subunit